MSPTANDKSIFSFRLRAAVCTFSLKKCLFRPHAGPWPRVSGAKESRRPAAGGGGGGGRREAGGGRWASPIPGRDLPARELPATALCREAGPLKIRGFPGTRVLTFPVRLHREAEMERTSPSSRIKPGYTSAEKTKRLSFFWDVLFLDKLCSGCPQIQLGHCEALLGSQLG